MRERWAPCWDTVLCTDCPSVWERKWKDPVKSSSKPRTTVSQNNHNLDPVQPFPAEEISLSRRIWHRRRRCPRRHLHRQGNRPRRDPGGSIAMRRTRPTGRSMSTSPKARRRVKSKIMFRQGKGHRCRRLPRLVVRPRAPLAPCLQPVKANQRRSNNKRVGGRLKETRVEL